MSVVIVETSPRALLDTALQLSYTLNLMGDHDESDAQPAVVKGPGFVLKEVERVLLQVRSDLDIPQGDVSDRPLMMRLRDDIDKISAVLTGNSVEFLSEDTTTLHELIESMSMLNKSVCTQRSHLFSCTIQ
jgi:hypothetical protein